MSSRYVSNSSTELVKIKNRLSDTETKSRLDLNDNIDTFRGIVFVADTRSAFARAFRRLLGDVNEKLKEFQPKEAILNKRNDPELVADGDEGNYYQVYVYFIDEDSPAKDPRTEAQGSAAYWAKVKKLNRALVPKKVNGSISKPENESEYKFKFLKGGPRRNEWYSGIALYREPHQEDDDFFANLFNNQNRQGSNNSGGNQGGGGGNQGGGGSGGSGAGFRPGENIQKPVLPPDVEQLPNAGIFHWECVSNKLTWVNGERTNYIDDTVHEDRRTDILLASNANTSAATDVGGYLDVDDGTGLNLRVANYISYQDVKDKLPWFEIERYRRTVIAYESLSRGYLGQNPEGYLGAYQMGYDAMRNSGFLPGIPAAEYNRIKRENGNYTLTTTAKMMLAADWDSQMAKDRWGEPYALHMQTLKAAYAAAPDRAAQKIIEEQTRQYFKDNPEAQDNMFATYTISRLHHMEWQGLVDLSDPIMMHAHSMGTHLRGFGSDSKVSIWWEDRQYGKGLYAYVRDGIDSEDDYGTKFSSYYRKGAKGWLEKNGDPCVSPNSGGNP